MLERLELLIGKKINILKNKTVLLIGLGGVGSYAFESMVRCGVGKIIVVDSDTIDITNLNRQSLALKTNIGNYKVDEALKKGNLIGDSIIITINKFIDKNNIELLFKEKIDFLIDAIDTIETKKIIMKECSRRKIKFISSMGMANKMDASRVKISEIDKTSYDPIAKIIRKYKKEEKIKKIMVVYSDEKKIKVNGLGSNSFVPSVAGLLCTSYVINKLLEE